MVSVRGTFRNGCAQPEEAVEGHEGQPVIITFLEGIDASKRVVDEDAAWEAFLKTVNENQVDTGVADLAHEHDHYVHSKEKKGKQRAPGVR